MAVLCHDILDLKADGEYIELLLRREEKVHKSRRTRDPSTDPARADVVRWIMATKASLGFGLKTAYTAVAYFDRFFEHKSIESMRDKTWALKLLSVACLSLAAKMEEIKVLAISEFAIGEDYRFSSEAVQRMELLVLSTMEWRMLAVTPFPYLNFFASKLEETPKDLMISNSIKFIFAAIEVMSSVRFQPSEVAAAAILAALDERLTCKSVESKMIYLSSSGLSNYEHVFACYTLMIQQSHKLRSSNILASFDASPANSTMTSSKRRRLQ
ncbi:cyclin-D5-3-like isoform X3 [Canna indica]|uniref:Cyclin-D5-3-like isoform X3 n=1 Tax=Canna indica TaxID=4628 RepID=A0AAQ3L651_9LILI|nr:cyclin-D5-3-like isoform X3 [Canna indica]